MDSETKIREENKEQVQESKIEKKDKNIAKLKEIFSPIIPILKNRVARYIVSFIFVAIVVYFYILFEGNRGEETVRIIFFDMSSDLLVPIALILAFIAVLYASWDDKFLKRFRSPGLYMILLTAIFYILIYSGVDEYLFQTSLAKWLTQATAVIVTALVKLFGLEILDTNWSDEHVLTIITYNGALGQSQIGIDARCSGIHSLTIFIAIFFLMIFEARKRLKWDYKIILIVLIGIVGTYLVNLLRVIIIFIINYYKGWDVAGPIHNYLGYVFLMIWVPIFWLLILPWGEKEKKKKSIETTEEESEILEKNEQDLEVEETTTTEDDSAKDVKPP